MSNFRKSPQKVVYVHWRGEPVEPAKGCFTVYYWVKGDSPETWVKADIYGPDGRLCLEGALADSLDELKKNVPEDLKLFGVT